MLLLITSSGSGSCWKNELSLLGTNHRPTPLLYVYCVIFCGCLSARVHSTPFRHLEIGKWSSKCKSPKASWFSLCFLLSFLCFENDRKVSVFTNWILKRSFKSVHLSVAHPLFIVFFVLDDNVFLFFFMIVFILSSLCSLFLMTMFFSPFSWSCSLSLMTMLVLRPNQLSLKVPDNVF